MLPQMTITFRHIPRSSAVESMARELGHRLENTNDRMRSCHIAIEGRDLPGGIVDYLVKIHLTLPSAQIHANNTQASGMAHTEVRAALRAAYHDAKRQLEDLRQVRNASYIAAIR